MTPAARPSRRSDLTTVELDGEAVVYDEAGGDLHHLNPAATIVFSLCDGTLTVEQMAAEVTEAFRLEPAAALADVRAAVDSLSSAGLLR